MTALAPFLRDTPQIAGDPRVDETLSLFGGRWDGSTPITFTYSWRRCNPVGDPPTCVQIPGATEATYTQQVADIGFSIRVWITGTNTAGSDVAITNHTGGSAAFRAERVDVSRDRRDATARQAVDREHRRLLGRCARQDVVRLAAL